MQPRPRHAFAWLVGNRPVAPAGVIWLGSAASAGFAQGPDSLPRPPGVRIATLPSVPVSSGGSNPYETTVALHPRDPRRLVVTFQQPSHGRVYRSSTESLPPPTEKPSSGAAAVRTVIRFGVADLGSAGEAGRQPPWQ